MQTEVQFIWNILNGIVVRRPWFSPWVDLGGGQRPKFNFFKYGLIAYQIKGNDTCYNMVANFLPIHPTLGVGSKGQNLTFSEHGHVAYHIKGKHECSNMQAHILSLDTRSTPGV